MIKNLFLLKHRRSVGGYLALTGILIVVLLLGFVVKKAILEPDEEVRIGDTIITGPWGEVRYWCSVMEMPPELVANLSKSSGQPTEWFIELSTEKEVDQMLDQCGMSRVMRTVLMTTALKGTDGIRLFPSDSLVISIPSDVRAKLYALLTQWAYNDAYKISTRFAMEGTFGWLAESGLPVDVIQLTQKLIYSRNDAEMFADYNIVLRTIRDNQIARRFLRVMCRQGSVMGVLVVRPTDDLEVLTRYWGRGGNENEVRTLLETARVSAGRHEVPLASLMPPFVKEHIYRYCKTTDPDMSNCHYTSMNFFSIQPDDSFTNFIACAESIDLDYVAVENEFQLGDVVMLMRNSTSAIHSCTIICGNLVFTKNGHAKGQPWAIRSMESLLLYYEGGESLQLRVFRRRDMI